MHTVLEARRWSRTQRAFHHGLPGRAAIAAMTLSLAACGGAGASGTGEAPAGKPAVAATPASSGTVDLDGIFPQGPGRDLVLNNCQNCHTFVPIVVLQMDADAWKRNSVDHRPRIPNVSDADFATMYEYLPQHFNPARPVPELPRELLETWTSY